MPDKEAMYTNKIFLNAVLPLMKVIAADVPSLSKKFEKVHCVYQVSCLDSFAPEGKYATHFTVNGNEWKVCTDKVEPKPMIDLEFKSVEAMNAFFKGKIGPATLPKMKGIAKNMGAFVPFLMTLLKMSSLLSAKEAPADEETKKLTVKCFFYLLSVGISTLNKQGHAEVHDWTMKSPDRVYAWKVNGYDDISAFIRIKAGKSRAGKGEYKRAMPFFTMRFDSLDSALGILLGTADMIASVKEGKLIMDGAPEFGGQLGAYMMTVAGYAQ